MHSGGTAVFAPNALERRFRDIHTVAQQLQRRDDHYETVGKFLLGLVDGVELVRRSRTPPGADGVPVSYTHLTLPTIYSV